jgi:MFS family permease
MAAAGSHSSAPPLGESLDNAEMTPLHKRYWLLAALGVMLDGFDFFIIAVAIPLVSDKYDLGAGLKGLVSSAALMGAIVGAGLLGPLADKIGRRRIFKYDLVLFALFSVACVFPWSVWPLIVFRFVLGVAIGLDYPIAASYLAEVLPAKVRGRWLVGAFSLQAVGILMGAVVGVVVLELFPHVDAWRAMLGFGVVPAIAIIWLRRKVPESPRWLAQNGREEEAAEVGALLTGHPVSITEADTHRMEAPAEGLKAFVQPQLFRRSMLRRTIFTAAPWFLMDIATYGVGIFTPTLLATIVYDHPAHSFIASDIASTKGTAALDIFLVVGFATAIFLVERLGRVRLQLNGFAVMAGALCLLALTQELPGGGDNNVALVFLGFAFFNMFMNAGPNATTYALPAEVFPSEIRAAGHGFAAASGKLGAVVGVYLFPTLENDIGTDALLYAVAGCCLLGFLVTAIFRVEPKGRSLDEVSKHSLGFVPGLAVESAAP